MRPEIEAPGRNMGPGSQTGRDIIQRPPTPCDRITGLCKNITLPKTSFVGGNYGKTLIPTLYSHIFAVSFFICIIYLVTVKLDISRKNSSTKFIFSYGCSFIPYLYYLVSKCEIRYQ